MFDRKAFVFILPLLALHVGIFWQHYFGAASFPGDFRNNYFPMTSFWISLVREGIFPEWLPYQNIGLPFLMTMQSGVFYPPLWFFVIPGAPDYSLHAANVMQALHVLWGALGVWIHARSRGLSPATALLGAIAFHCFGGFYSNSDSADMVRAYAWLPWLLHVTTVLPSEQQLQRRHWLAPLVVFCVITGSYPGNLMSHAFIMTLFFIACCVQRRSATALYMRVGLLVLLGVGLASVFILPALAMKPLMDRGDGWSGFRVGWLWSYWNTLVMPTDFEGPFVKKTMLSAFITVPIFSLLFLVNRPLLARHWPWLLLIVISLLMAQGNGSMVFDTVIRLLPFLDFSRFPASDYKGLLCLGLIMLALFVFDENLMLASGGDVFRRMCLACGIPLFFITFFLLHASMQHVVASGGIEAFSADWPRLAAGIYGAVVFLSGAVLPAALMEWAVYLTFTIVFFALVIGCNHRKISGFYCVVLIILITVVSGVYMLYRSGSYWRTPEGEKELYAALQISGEPSIVMAVENPPVSRPACLDTMSWRGFLDGSFICVSAGSIISKAWLEREWYPALRDAMKQPWQAYTLTVDQLHQCDTSLVIRPENRSAYVQQASYGLKSVDYRISAVDDFCFVETEMFFPGWSGVIDLNGKIVEPHRWCGSVRAWCLPEGKYRLQASYSTPWLKEGVLISFACLMLYIVALFYVRYIRSDHS